MTRFAEKTRRFLADNDLFHNCTGCLLAVSGGPDSMAMLRFFCSEQFPFPIAVAHVHHGLRRESDAEQEMVERFCRANNIPFYLHKADIRRTRPKGTSEESHARQIRYAFFEEQRKALGFSHLATAHTADDNVEVFFLHLVRGSGTAGLCGMEPLRDGHIAHPLLAVTKADTVSYCRETGTPYAIDRTNAEPICRRNRLRNEILPLFHAENPSFSEAVLRTERTLAADECFLSAEAETVRKRLTVSGTELKLDQTVPPALLSRALIAFFKTLSDTMLSQKHVDALTELIYKKKTSASVQLPDGFTAKRDYTVLRFFREEPEAVRFGPIPVAIGDVELPGIGILRVTHVQTGADLNDEHCHDLSVRSFQTGDRVCFFRKAGSKTLKKLFSDSKIPATERMKIPVVTASGTPAWVSGFGTDCAFSHGSAGLSFVLLKK